MEVIKTKIRNLLMLVLRFLSSFSFQAHKERFVLILFILKNIQFLRKDIELISIEEADKRFESLRQQIRFAIGLKNVEYGKETLNDLQKEIDFIFRYYFLLKFYFRKNISRRVLYVGHCYYNCYYLSRGLRKVGWRADVLNWDTTPESQIHYHGYDFQFEAGDPYDIERDLRFFVSSLYRYDVFHFSNKGGMCFGFQVLSWFAKNFRQYDEIKILKKIGKKVVYSNNGCQDGVTKSSFSKWKPESVCEICAWRDNEVVCSDQGNSEWGKFRNSVADYQCLLGGNRIDYNLAPTVHEEPGFYCLDENIWDPSLSIPEQFLLSSAYKKPIYLYHAVGNKDCRTSEDGVNIKSSHIHLPLIKKLQGEGYPVELISPNNVPNKSIRFYQMQADIFLDMLSFGWFGANAREAMMLGKPVICFIRPEWLESLRHELPEYAAELPVISATPQTVEPILKDLLENPDKRLEIGEKSRHFAIKWHSNVYGARRFNEIYTKLLLGDPLLLDKYR